MKCVMFQMAFGESVLFTEDDKCLLVDCGSKKPDDNVGFRSDKFTEADKRLLLPYYRPYYDCLFDNVYNELAPFQERAAVITHFHDDHYNGFLYLADKGVKFERLYLPDIFSGGGHINAVDYILMAHYLRNKMVRRGKTPLSMLDLFKKLSQNKIPYTLTKRGEYIQALGDKHEVRWPEPSALHSDPKYPKRYHDFQNTLDPWGFMPLNILERIFVVSDSISGLYVVCQNGEYSNAEQAIMRIESELENLDHAELDPYHQGIELANGSRISDSEGEYVGFEALIKNPITKAAAREIIKKAMVKANESSVVFQTCNGKKDFLMTGDITRKYLEEIIYDKSIPLHSEFYAIKAPHHGTSNHFCRELFDANSCLKKEIVFISNGSGHPTAKGISSRYIGKGYRLICTVADPSRCPGYSNCKNGDCWIMRGNSGHWIQPPFQYKFI